MINESVFEIIKEKFMKTILLTIIATLIFGLSTFGQTNKCVSGNCVNGKGKYIFANGDIYEGDFVNSKMSGQGTYTYKNGDIYIGQWKNGSYHGKGELNVDFDSFEGDFVNGKLEGQGTESGIFGQVYDGQWKNGKYHGKGKLELSLFDNNDVYEGNFVDGKKEGQGKMTYEDGGYYIGEWKNDKRNGYGKEYVKATNITQVGTWKDGVYVGTANPKPATPISTNSNAAVSNAAEIGRAS